MVLDDLAIAFPYEHIFVAPHLDDVALSSGGLVGKLVAEGQTVLVVNLCAGSPDPAQPLAPFAQYLHEAWGLGDDPVALRRAEDRLALAVLGVDGLYLNELDAIYRYPNYAHRDGVFGKLLPDDRLILAARSTLQTLRMRNPTATFYLPLAVGNHVDHQAVFAAQNVIPVQQLKFYEDFPYAAQPGATEQRLTAIEQPLVSRLVAVEPYIEQKIRSIAAYDSQLSELFPTTPMAQVVADYATMVGGSGQQSERLWLRNG